jgi:hypothetical protein
MTNDTTTLNGSLLEMKDQLIYELGQKGVTATYSSATGLLGLIAQISDIETGGSCYHIEFNSSSYEASGGSATISCTLQENYAVKSGATVTFTGSDSSVYTGITNSNGVATVTVTGISSTTTFTASYSNVSDTCTVTVPAPAYSLSFSQSTYTCDMMDGCTVSCTLKNGNTPMSGETITLSYTDLLGPVAINVITTSSGVVTYHYESYDFGLGVLPVTLTATYQGVTATCTIVEG